VPKEALNNAKPNVKRSEETYVRYMPIIADDGGEPPKRRVVLAWRRSFTRYEAIAALRNAVYACELPGVSRVCLEDEGMRERVERLYLDLIRWNRPAGWLLLLWPSLSVPCGWLAGGWPGWHLLSGICSGHHTYAQRGLLHQRCRRSRV
jgi:hypothetical protein